MFALHTIVCGCVYIYVVVFSLQFANWIFHSLEFLFEVLEAPESVFQSASARAAGSVERHEHEHERDREGHDEDGNERRGIFARTCGINR